MTSNTKLLKNTKIAIVHDWLIGGGAEKVVEALHQMYPDAPIYSSYCTDEWRTRLNNKVITGYLQHWPFNKLRKFIPLLRIWWFERLNLSEYDIVISTSGAEAKGIKTKPETLHINYCHAPTHYYWNRYDQYLKNPGFGFFDPLARLGLKLFVAPLRKWDYRSAQRPDFIIANSTFTKNQIKKYYNRSSTVIFPPVNTDKFKPSKKIKRHGFVIVGRQTPYKRFDLAVLACTKLNLPLTVIGKGPDHNKLKNMAGPSITFKSNLTDTQLIKELQSASAFLFPGLDDFGIAPVEALASGCPVIAFKDGGALDYVKPNRTGVFFKEQSVESLAEVLQNFKSQKFDSTKISKFSTSFSPDTFKDRIKTFVDSKRKGKNA